MRGVRGLGAHEELVREFSNAKSPAGFSRAYLRHCVNVNEMLGLRLISLHNVTFYCGLMGRMREAIREGRFGAFAEAFLGDYGADGAGLRPDDQEEE